MAYASNSSPAQVNRPDAGHDIFCTPENGEFMSKNPYLPLDKVNKEIRLLRIRHIPDEELLILQGEKEAFDETTRKHGTTSYCAGDLRLRCELLQQQSIDQVKEKYYALSYCAGDPTTTRPILVNGSRCSVFANLEHALHYTLKCHTKNHRSDPASDQAGLGDIDVVIWADQVCINQHNLAERSHQVSMMQDIYRSAKETVVCLSTPDTNGKGGGIDWYHEYGERLATALDNSPGASVMTAIRNSEILRYFIRDHQSTDFWNGMSSFCEILYCDWWSRVWVFQEFVVSRQVCLVWMEEFVTLDENDTLLHAWSGILRTMTREGNTWGLGGRFYDSFLTSDAARDCISKYAETSKGSRYLTAERMFKARREYSQKLNEWTLLQLWLSSAAMRASDARDKVFALLGLLSPGHGTRIDYSTTYTSRECFIDATLAIIQEEKSLEVLERAVQSKRTRRHYSFTEEKATAEDHILDLPSWCIDFAGEDLSAANNSITEGKFVKSHFPGMDRAKGPFIQAATWIRQPAIRVRGVSITSDFYWESGAEHLGHYPCLSPQKPELYPSNLQLRVELDSPTFHTSDEVWLLFGSPKAWILRPQGDYHELIGSPKVQVVATNYSRDQNLDVLDSHFALQSIFKSFPGKYPSTIVLI